VSRQHSPPKDFGPDLIEVWQVAQRQLRLQGTWEKSDGPLLEAYCHNVVKAREARARADEYRHSSSIELATVLKIVANAEAAALALAKSLLLTPESRRRNGVRSPGKGVEDELQALIS
jgi:phage terminase small subunit